MHLLPCQGCLLEPNLCRGTIASSYRNTSVETTCRASSSSASVPRSQSVSKPREDGRKRKVIYTLGSFISKKLNNLRFCYWTNECVFNCLVCCCCCYRDAEKTLQHFQSINLHTLVRCSTTGWKFSFVQYLREYARSDTIN